MARHLVCAYILYYLNGCNADFPTLQSFYTQRSLAEQNITMPKNLACNHQAGTCTLGGRTFPVLFPHYLTETARSLRCQPEKRTGYFFQGVTQQHASTARKHLLKQFYGRNDTTIIHSTRGRQPRVKYTVDTNYLRGLCCAKFALTPTGECPWSYRFFEAIMCHTIPVIAETDYDIFAPYFFHIRVSNSTLFSHVYDLEMAKHNMRLLRQWHMLPGAAHQVRHRDMRPFFYQK